MEPEKGGAFCDPDHVSDIRPVSRRAEYVMHLQAYDDVISVGERPSLRDAALSAERALSDSWCIACVDA